MLDRDDMKAIEIVVSRVLASALAAASQALAGPQAGDGFTVKDLARRYGVTEAAIWKRVRERTFPAPTKVGRRSRWSEVVVQAHEQKDDK